MGKYFPELEFLIALLGDKPILEPKVCFYQRLSQEAGAVLEEYLKGKQLVDACDTILIPALGLAEQDRHRGVLDENREKFALENVDGDDRAGKIATAFIKAIGQHRHWSREMKDPGFE